MQATVDTTTSNGQQPASLEVATLGGGCFWCLEAVYDDLQGVTDVVSGYAGGHVQNPDYKSVCTGRTGHAEVVQVTFDPSVVTYEDVLGIFFAIHDPTTLNRQGADVGTQYRSAIFVHSPEQRAEAERSKAAARRSCRRAWSGSRSTVPLSRRSASARRP